MLASLFSWWGTTNTDLSVLVLHPTPEAAKTVAGFRGGKDLEMKVVVEGETVAQVLDRLNIYRGPDQILQRVWIPNSAQELPGSTVVRGKRVAEVRPESIVQTV